MQLKILSGVHSVPQLKFLNQLLDQAWEEDETVVNYPKIRTLISRQVAKHIPELIEKELGITLSKKV